MIEIRSYRRVFDLERRIYSIDRLRLNPGGVPVRGVVYVLAAALVLLVLRRLPLIGAAARIIPWYLWDLLLPALAGGGLSQLTIAGRSFHLVALSGLSFYAQPRELVAMGSSFKAMSRWYPSDVVVIPAGSEKRTRPFVYRGPGTASVAVHDGAPLEVHERRRVRFLGSSRPADRQLVVSLSDQRATEQRCTFEVGAHATLRLVPRADASRL
jgi:hypothetical protein